LAPAQYTNGIYAEFNTSMGSFTNQLDYQLAPKATANFIGLATGERAWLDLPSGQVKTNPFFNGITFHRVIAGFMCQGGSPNGQGTDGPGYEFVDEFDPLARHDSFGTLSSANSGPDSNGSQFFVTAGPTPWLDDIHTVFGKLFGGSNVVYEINNVETDANDKPLTNVVIQSVVIRRIGPAAEAFDIHAQDLPVVTPLNLHIEVVTNQLSLTFSNRLDSENWLYSTTNLSDWNPTRIGMEVVNLSTNPVSGPADSPQEFFHLVQVQHQVPLFVPRNLLNKTVTLNFTGANGTVVCNFNSVGSGTYTWTIGPSGTITGYSYSQDPYRGRLRPIEFTGIVPLELHLDFDSQTAGTFKGKAYTNSGTVDVSGTFTSTP